MSSPAPWSRPAGHHAPVVHPVRAGAPFANAAHAYAQPPFPGAYAYPYPGARRSETPPALYVLGSFALMLLLAAVMSVFGSVAALALIEAGGDVEPPAAEAASPAASLGR